MATAPMQDMAEDTTEGSAGVYVYGIVRAGQRTPAGLRGVGSPPGRVRFLRAGALTAVVSDAPAGLRARRRDLLAHQELLLALASRGPVLPMRFGTVSRDEDSVLERVRSAAADQLSALDGIEGCVEMNLKAHLVQECPGDVLRDLVERDPQVRRLREEARRRPGYEANVRLGEAVAVGLQRRAVQAADRALRALSPLADRVAAGPEVSGCVLNTSFLVAEGSRERFEAAAARVTAGREVELRLTGPLPCYSFVASEPVPAGR